MMSKTLEKWLKLADELDDKGRHPLYDRDYWSALGEKYIGLDVSYHVHLSLRDTLDSGRTGDFCIEFYGVNSVNYLPKSLGLIPENNMKNGLIFRQMSNICGGYSYFDNTLVLVEVGQIPEHGEGMKRLSDGLVQVPSFVWLKALNFCPVIRAYFLKSPYLLLPSLLGVTDWELDNAHVLDMVFGIDNCELADEVVKRRAEIVNSIAENERCFLKLDRKVGLLTDVKKMLVGTPVIIKSDSYSFGRMVESLQNVNIKGINMFCGPVDFPPDIVKRMSVCYHPPMTKKSDAKQITNKGYKIPIPNREDFYLDLEKASKPDRPSRPARRSRKKSKKR